jgi:hypothetical protein
LNLGYPSNKANSLRIAQTREQLSKALVVDEKQLMRKFKHAPDFGVDGNNNGANRAAFESQVREHVANPQNAMIFGQMRAPNGGNMKVVFHLNVDTSNVVITTRQNQFISAYRLNDAQYSHVMRDGKLGGG